MSETSRVYGGIIVDVVEDDLSRISAILGGSEGKVKKAVGYALARAGQSARTVAAKAVTKEYAISYSQFTSRTRNINHFKNAGGGGSLQVVFGYAGKVIPLVQFDTSLTKGGAVSSRVKRSSTKETLDHAFIARMRGKHTGVYERTTPSRFPVRELFGPATPQMIYSNEEVMDAVEEKIVETYEKRIDHEVSRILNGG